MIHHQIVIGHDLTAKRLIPALTAAIPHLKSGQIYKALRRRDVRCNGRRIQADQPVAPGDVIDLYLPENEAAVNFEQADSQKTPEQPSFRVIYQDDAILILNKKAGVVVHGTAQANEQEEATLISQVKEQLKDPALVLCHRLDRNTGGLIILARDPQSLAAVTENMKSGLITKRYRCLVRGEPLAGRQIQTPDGKKFWQIEAYLEKRARQNEVFIHDEPRPGDVPVITRYRILRRFPGLGPDGETVCELEVELVTGRTHQIRAHLAHIGHPLLGDGKYGRNAFNRFFRGPNGPLVHQQLFACQLLFAETIQSSRLKKVTGKSFQVQPDYDLELPDQSDSPNLSNR